MHDFTTLCTRRLSTVPPCTSAYLTLGPAFWLSFARKLCKIHTLVHISPFLLHFARAKGTTLVQKIPPLVQMTSFFCVKPKLTDGYIHLQAFSAEFGILRIRLDARMVQGDKSPYLTRSTLSAPHRVFHCQWQCCSVNALSISKGIVARSMRVYLLFQQPKSMLTMELEKCIIKCVTFV